MYIVWIGWSAFSMFALFHCFDSLDVAISYYISLSVIHLLEVSHFMSLCLSQWLPIYEYVHLLAPLNGDEISGISAVHGQHRDSHVNENEIHREV